ncbi:MAG: DNA-dependent DNA polymerase beta chain, partial [uncultured Blastococcus sp.]
GRLPDRGRRRRQAQRRAARPEDPHQHAQGPQGRRPQDGRGRRRGAQGPGARVPDEARAGLRRAGADGRRRRALPRGPQGRPAPALRLVRRRQPDPRDGRGSDRAGPRVPGPHRPLAQAHRGQRADAGAAGGAAGRRRRVERGAGALPDPHRHRVRHQRRRQPRPDRGAARPPGRRRRQRALRPAGGLDSHDRPHADGGREPAHRRPRSLHRPAGHRAQAAQRNPEAAAGKHLRRRGGVRRLRRVRHGGGDQLPPRAARPAPPAADPRRRARLRVRHRHRRPRPRPAGLAGQRLRAGAGDRRPRRPRDQHLGRRRPAGLDRRL